MYYPEAGIGAAMKSFDGSAPQWPGLGQRCAGGPAARGPREG